jgi:predicted nucleic acid-binding protein
MRIYLDNCCYSRPYDGQEQLKVQLETEAKLFIQSLVKLKAVKLIASFVLIEEANIDINEGKRNCILEFIKSNSAGYVAKDMIEIIKPTVVDIEKTGIKAKDSTHLACAILAKCNYFISTDKRLLKYQTDRIKLINPIDFKKIWEETTND